MFWITISGFHIISSTNHDFIRDLLKYLTVNTGTNVSSVYDAEVIYDTLSIEQAFNMVSKITLRFGAWICYWLF